MLKTNCPICDAPVTLPANSEESEIISCPDCHTRLVIADLKGSAATLQEAPKVEEDWGQ
jgi:lysine biosynthesis protein LysW